MIKSDFMDLAPIILFAYNRPMHIKKTLEALKNNVYADESVLIIFSDAAKNDKDISSVEQVRDFIKSVCGFNEIIIHERGENLGLANSIISGVTEIINIYGRAIVLEDDIVTSPHFLKFMNEALDFYKDDKKIYSLSGYNFPINIPKSYKHQVYLLQRPSSWGWATWKDRWEKAEWKPETTFNIMDKKAVKKLMDNAGKDLAPMLLKSIEGKISSWAVKWAFTHLKNDSYCLYPIKSLVNNIGTDKSGTNFKKKVKKYTVNIEYYNSNFIFQKELHPVNEIQEQIYSLVNPGTYRKLINFILGY